MRATFINKPYEFKLDIFGEQWHQGEIVKGKVEFKTKDYMNQSSLAELGVFLCLIDLKKFKNKNDKGITVINEKIFPELGEYDFTFALDSGAFISEKNTSLCLLVGDKRDLFTCGLMQLKIIPQKLFLDFVEVFETFYRFKLKSIKSKKSETEFVFTPPAAKEFTNITKFSMVMTLDNHSADKIWLLTVISCSNKLSMENFQTTTVEDIVTFPNEFKPRDYIAFASQINKEFFINFLKDLLDKIKLKPLI